MWISTHLALMTPTFGNFGADLRLLQSLGAALILSSRDAGVAGGARAISRWFYHASPRVVCPHHLAAAGGVPEVADEGNPPHFLYLVV